MTFDERQKWVRALLACSAVRNRQTRDVIVDELSAEMKTSILRSEIDNVDVMNILKRVLEFDNGIFQLVQIVRFYEGNNLPMQAVQQLYDILNQGQSVGDSVTNDCTLAYANQPSSLKEDHQPLKSSPKSSTTCCKRGDFHREKGQYELAIAEYDQAIQLNPEYVIAYNNRGLSYRKLGQHEEAIQDYEKAMQLNPEYVYAYYNRGYAYQDLNEYKRAIEDYSQAIKLDPKYADAYYWRGFAYKCLGQYEKADEDSERFMELTS